MRTLRLEAEADAWPLCSPAAFHAGIVDMVDGKALMVLQQGLADRLSRYGPSPFPSDSAAARWGKGAGVAPPATILEWLRRLAGERLRLDGGVARLVRPSEEPPGWAEVRWRFFTLRVPPEILLAALAAGAGMASTPARVDLLHPLLRSDQPTAHLHVHLAAMGSTAAAWASLRERLRNLQDCDRLPGAPEPGDPLTAGLRAEESGQRDGRLSWTEALRRAMWAEVVLGNFLADAPQCDFETWVKIKVKDAAQESALWELAMGRLHRESPEQEAERRLSCAISADFQRNGSSDSVLNSGKSTDHARPEVYTELLRSTLARLHNTPDVWLQRLFVQLVRMRCFFHQALVMDPSAPGFSSFYRYERLLPVLSPKIGAAMWEGISNPVLQVGAAEVRFGPPKGALRKNDLALAENAPIETAWVIHFSRGCRESLRECPWPPRVKEFVEQADKLFGKVLSLQAQSPRLLATLRGLDLAGEESEGPFWLYAPVLRDLRARLDRECATVGVPGIRLTVHVGESFRHLASGLRAIHEPLLFGLARDGDRLGHALALGLDPARWATRNARVWVRRWDRLLDLGWIQRATASLGAELEIGALLRFQDEERRLWRELCEWAPSGSASLGERHAGALHGALGRMELAHVRDLGSPGQLVGADDGLAALRLLCSRAEAWRWAISLMPVDTTPEVQTLISVRDALCRHIASRQLVIEVNPSSNLLIADLDHPLDQPMFHLRPIDPQERRGLPVCISADDPLTFATCFEDEVAYAWAGMVGSGQVPAAQARAWIEEALQVGWRARFTLPKMQTKQG